MSASRILPQYRFYPTIQATGAHVARYSSRTANTGGWSRYRTGHTGGSESGWTIGTGSWSGLQPDDGGCGSATQPKQTHERKNPLPNSSCGLMTNSCRPVMNAFPLTSGTTALY